MNASATTELELSVIVPAFNEAARISPGVQAIMDYLRSGGWSWELIVVDDGSADELFNEEEIHEATAA